MCDSGMFRSLDPEEYLSFQKWAHENYNPGDPIKGIWHPVIQAECVAMNAMRFSANKMTYEFSKSGKEQG